jgi:HTH-type transcriptional regulator/antitoxin HigA
VQKHLKKSASHLFIADNLDDKTRSSQEEREADDGAREALIPLAEWDNAAVKVMPTTENAIALANKLRIHPAIVAGRVRYETNNWRILSSLLGTKGEVRKIFENQLGGSQARTS